MANFFILFSVFFLFFKILASSFDKFLEIHAKVFIFLFPGYNRQNFRHFIEIRKQFTFQLYLTYVRKCVTTYPLVNPIADYKFFISWIFRCEKCDQFYPTKYLHTRHSLVHLTGKEFKCLICHKGFKTSENLKVSE
jgi:hypothetical protein